MSVDIEMTYEGDFPQLVIFKASGEPEHVLQVAERLRETFPDETKIIVYDDAGDTDVNVVPDVDEDGFSRFSRDPEALAWARGHVEGFVAKMRNFERMARESGGDEGLERARNWRRIANILEMQFVGGEGCVITPFDERLPAFADVLEQIGE